MTYWKQTTRFVVTAGILLIAAYDLVAFYFGGNAATISQYVPTLPSEVIFALGFVFGHLLWPQNRSTA